MNIKHARLIGVSLCLICVAAALSGCPPRIAVPNVVGLDQAAAEAAIVAAGLVVGAVTEENSDTVPAGQVISQTPEAGMMVAGGLAVDLVVSLGPDLTAIHANFGTSLHGTREGKLTWWYGEEGEPGFSSLLEPDVNVQGCVSCHAANYADGTPVEQASYAPGCGDCHADPANPAANPVDAPTVCLGCHGRQEKELALAASTNPVVAARFTDVHRDAGMACTDCHGFDEIHGDGAMYSSAYASPSPDCQNCHVDGGPAGATVPPATVPEHAQHTDTIHCSTCHMQTVISCYNCHIESLVSDHMKRANTALSGFRLLMNRVADGKIVPGSFQSASYQGQKLIALGGFTTHTITDQGLTCDDCHNNANVQAYNTTGEVVLGTWDPAANQGAGAIVGIAGVAPIPPDYKDAIKLDFLNYSAETGWSLLEDTGNPENTNTPDLVQMAPSLFEPMTAFQMQMLGLDMTP